MSSSNMEQMNMATPVKSGVFIKKKVILISLAIIAVILAAAIIATYFGTKATFNTASDSLKPEINTDSTQSTTGAPEAIDYRLPTDIEPILYELKIKPYVGTKEIYGDKSFTFEGENTMHLKCVYPTNKIVFHQIELVIDSDKLELTSESDSSMTFSRKIELDNVREFVTINLNKNCVKDADYKLVVPYTGVILEKLTGFYRSSYAENGTTYYIASTDFEPTDARRAFPCFDEPAMKAQWQLQMTRNKNFTATHFNAPLISSIPHPDEPNWMIDQFDKSAKMSTYLFAMIVSNFESVKMKSAKYNVNIEVAARPLAIQSGEGDFALKEAAQIIDFYSDYFNEKYPLSKSTQVAIPDFNSGAMENWGLVIYRESALLFNPTTDAIGNKHRVSEVIAHELAHQWFGNLVTMNWWNDIWLNEGFASWVEVIGMNHTHPEWRDLDYFFVYNSAVLVKDSLESSHPINFEVNNPSEIGGLFDSISYNKGASIIRMMNAFLTEPSFRKGVSNYLAKYKYGNAVQDDLWSELTKAAHEDNNLDAMYTVKQIMDTWTLQKGYPVIQINRNENNQLTATQKWFLLNPLNTVQNTTEYDDYKWFVPITHTTKKELDFNFEKKPQWLKPKDTDLKIDLNNVNDEDWVIANLKHTGFYRVNYDENNWRLLLNQLNTDHTLIDGTSRAALLDDSFNLGRAEIIDQTVYLEVASYLVKEEDPLAFTALFDGMEYMHTMLSNDYESFQLFNKFYLELIGNTYNRLGWNTNIESYNEINLQTSVLRLTCRSGYQPCIDQARTYYNNWLNNGVAIPSNFKTLVYRTIIESGNEEDWQRLFNITKNTENPAEKLRMLSALASSKDLKILSYYLEQAQDTSIVKAQDQVSIIARISINSYGNKIAFEWMDREWNTLIEKYGNVAFTLPYLVDVITRDMNTQYDQVVLERFLANHPNLGIAGPAFRQAKEKAATNTRWMDTNLQSIRTWLKTNA